MPLSKSELLKSRYIVEAPMPGAQFSHLLPGDILEEKDHPLYQSGTVWGHVDETDVCKWTTICPNYPHLFRPLPWNEKRDIEDMPEYVKMVPESILVAKSHKFDWEPCYKVSDWRITEKGNVQGQTKDGWFIVTHFTPATREEYESYINSKTETK